MYQVLARKWRPRTFEEVLGQAQITRTLANAIEANRLAHAYIFAGLRGTGKTSVARIFARCLNCERGPVTEPCNRCTACEEIAESRALDVLELDAASRTSVDDIRELQEVISFAPVRDRYKILIIDEAHMLSKNAFNALLKTLEEPPPNVIFVLATTEIQKLLPTILSRCQVFEFRRVGVGELAEHLRRIGEAEKIRISDLALERIARAGEGSVRDSLSILERVLAFCGDEVADEDLLRMLGGVRSEVLTSMVAGFSRRDASAMLGVLDSLLDEGHDLVHFWTELISALRDLMLLRAVPDRASMLARSPEEGRALADAADGLSDEDLMRAFQIVADLEPGLKASTQPRYLFEAALIRLASLRELRPIEDVLASLRSEDDDSAARVPSAQKKSRASGNKPLPPPSSARRSPPRGDLAARLIDRISEANPMLGVVVEDAESIQATENELVLKFGSGRQAMLRQLQRKESRELLTRHAEEVLGRTVAVRVEAESPGRGAGEEASTSSRKHESVPKKSAPPRRPSVSVGPDERGSLLEQAKQDPGVKKLLREFGAQVLDIRPLEGPREPNVTGDETSPLEEDA